MSKEQEKLFGLLSQELEIIKQIHGLCIEQTGLLNEDRIDELSASLDKSQEVKEQINGLHQESDPLMQSYASLPAGQKDGGIDKLITEIRDTTEKCAKINDENINAAKAKTQEQTKKIDEQSAKRKGIGGYMQSVPTTSEVFDKKT